MNPEPEKERHSEAPGDTQNRPDGYFISPFDRGDRPVRLGSYIVRRILLTLLLLFLITLFVFLIVQLPRLL